MHKGSALLALAAFLAVGLAGCSSGSGESGGFSVNAPGAAGGEYVFKASGSADNYTWDMGDRLTVLYGKEVRHAYDFANGVVNVVLTAKTGDQSEDFGQPITLGTGTNAEPTFVLEGQRNWTVLGESLKFSARASTDPDGDPLRYSWSCIRTGDAVRAAGGHDASGGHGGAPATPGAAAPAPAIATRTAGEELPPADRIVAGDLCGGLGAASRPSLAATIEGSFERPGLYDVYLLASDPVHPTVSGKYSLVVTTPGERPPPVFQTAFFGNLTGGSNGAAQSAGDQIGMAFDRQTHTFSLPLTGLGGWVATQAEPQAVPGGTLSWTLRQGGQVVAQGGADGENVTLPSGLEAGSYTLEVLLQGPGVAYGISIEVPLDRDPFKVY